MFACVNMVGILLVIFISYSYLLFSVFHMHSGEEMQSLHMCVSPDSHHPVLFHLHLYLSETYFQLLLDTGQSSFHVLHSGHPHVESSDLQSLEYGSEEGFMEWNY